MVDQKNSEKPESLLAFASRRPVLSAVLVLACLVGAVFFPILHFEFIDFDVPRQVLENPYIRELTAENLKHIFTSRCVSSYYPVRTLSFALDYQVWGLNPMGFKLTNMLIHLANVLLLFWLILRVTTGLAEEPLRPLTWREVVPAALGAALFAVHPLVVEPVTWVAGREELLMTLGALGCIHFHLLGRQLAEGGAAKWKVVACFAAAAFACAFACLSNAAGAVIPALVIAWELILSKRRRVRNAFLRTSALWAIAIVAIVIKKIGYDQHEAFREAAALSTVIQELGYGKGQQSDSVGAVSVERLMLVFNVYWRNLCSIVWPNRLTLSYGPLAPKSFSDLEVALGGGASVLTVLLLWMGRRSRPALLGASWFLLALAPTAQLVPHHVHRADRFLYLPLVGLGGLLAVALRWAMTRFSDRMRLALVLGPTLLGMIVLSMTTARQVLTWRNDLSVWEQCVRVVPENGIAHRALADALALIDRRDEAAEHYRASLRLNLLNIRALNNFSRLLALSPKPNTHDPDLAVSLAEQACKLTRWANMHTLRTLAIAQNALGEDRRKEGDYRGAIEAYESARQTDPEYCLPVFNEALLLAICPDETICCPEKAVRLAEDACRMVGQPESNQVMILSVSYEKAGQLEAAVRTTREALKLAGAASETLLVENLKRRLASLEAKESGAPSP